MIFGAIIGIANIIPGVSGGTMAVILKVYDKLIHSISCIRTDFKNSMLFLIPIGIGAGAGILLFANIIEFSLAHFPVASNLVFVGLVIGSIPMIYGKATEKKISVGSIIAFVACLGVMLYMSFANPQESDAVITTLTVSNFFILFFAACVAAGAMIIPGISGSFVLLLLGIYTSVLTAISHFNLIILIPFGLGCAVGGLGCAKIIDKLFEKFPCQTYGGILGLMVGSIFAIFPAFSMNVEFIVGLALAALFAGIAFWFSKK